MNGVFTLNDENVRGHSGHNRRQSCVRRCASRACIRLAAARCLYSVGLWRVAWFDCHEHIRRKRPIPNGSDAIHGWATRHNPQ